MQNMASLLQGFGGGAFGNPAVAEPIVKMKVGKMEAAPIPDKPGKFMITPLPTKGQLQLVKDEQQILRFQWKDRVLNNLDQDINHMIFPGDAELIKVNSGREGDRVYMLQFSSNSSRRFFFWCQDKDDSKDAELVIKINETMNNPQSAADSATGNSEQAQMLQMLNLSGPSSETTEAPASTGTSGASAQTSTGSTQQVQLSSEYLQTMLQNLSNMPARTSATAASTSTSASHTSNATATHAEDGQGGNLNSADYAAAMRLAQGMTPRAELMSLPEIATADEIMRSGILEDEAIQQQLIALLPEGLQNPGELHASVHSPQFQQALTALTAALRSEQYNSIFANFGLDISAGAEALSRGDVIEAFLAALEAQRDAASDSQDAKTTE